jgi:RNA 2',3'-cyclic 3'-phosphodiesterase
MKRKIFISINIPSKVKKRLIGTIEKWHDLPIKWTWEDNLHVTLFFLGYIDDETAKNVCEIVAKVAQKEEIFEIGFRKIALAPDTKSPRMIWLEGEPSDNLLKLYEEIEKGLGIFKAPKKSFRPHITLGRIRKHKWEAMKDIPKIDGELPLILSVDSVDIMASHFEDSQGQYILIESCPLK